MSTVQWLIFNTGVGLLSEMAAVQWTFCVQSLDGGLTSETLFFAFNIFLKKHFC